MSGAPAGTWRWLAWSSLLLPVAHSINPIIVRGSKLYDSVTKKRFYVRGVAYAPWKYFQPNEGGDTSLVYDPKEDYFDDEHESWWGRDLQYLASLNINTVRLYEIDPFKSHDKFMSALANKGIYAVVSLTRSMGGGSLPAGAMTPECYPDSLKASMQKIVANMGKYDNLLSFVVANEVESWASYLGYRALPCVKALARDARAFMEQCAALRQIPLMYAMTDIGTEQCVVPNKPPVKSRKYIMEYLTCNDDGEGGNIDIFGLNIYSWCSATSTVTRESSYGDVTDEFQGLDLPFILSEFGCNQGDFRSSYPSWNNQRTWKSAGPIGLFSEKMHGVFSGGVAYEYSMTEKDYGLVLLPGYAKGVQQVVPLENFDKLAQQYAQALQTTEGWQEQEKADWAPGTMCDWAPPDSGTRRLPSCPSQETVECIWAGASKLWPPDADKTPNWRLPLPVASIEDQPCPAGAAVPTAQKCRPGPPTPPTPVVPTPSPTGLDCSTLLPLPACTVDAASLPGEQVGAFFDVLCGTKFYHSADPLWCSKAFNSSFGGLYAACDLQQKLDAMLQEWYRIGGECCAPDPHMCTEAPTPPTFPTRPPTRFTLPPTTPEEGAGVDTSKTEASQAAVVTALVVVLGLLTLFVCVVGFLRKRRIDKLRVWRRDDLLAETEESSNGDYQPPFPGQQAHYTKF